MVCLVASYQRFMQEARKVNNYDRVGHTTSAVDSFCFLNYYVLKYVAYIHFVYNKKFKEYETVVFF